MGYNKSLSDVYSETWTRYKNQCETDGYIALNRFCAGTGVNVQRLYEWLRRRKISISDYQRTQPERLPHPQMEQLTSPRKYPLPRQVSARVAQGASTVEGKRLGGKSETRTKIIQTKNQ